MKIAITGGSGFIGKWLLKDACPENELLVLGRKLEMPIPNVPEQLCTYVQTDYSTSSLCELLSGSDAVVHLAAERTGPNALEAYLPNITISNNVFESCFEVGVKNIIALSSISVYSAENPLPWSENQRVMPQTFYGISKATMENLACYYNAAKGLSIKCLRMARVLGLHERPGFMLNTFIEQASKKEVLKVFGRGEGRREYIYVKDVTGAIMNALEHIDAEGIFNIGTGNNLSHAEMALLINKVFDNEGNVVYAPEIAEDKSIYLMNIEKAARELSWTSKWTIEDGLREIKDDLTIENNH